MVRLWQDDECHATLEGTYLGACVFYAVLFAANPEGLEFYGGLSPEVARFCQDVAWQTVSGIEESPRPQAASHKPTATFVGELPAGAVVYDESGADVTARAGSLGRGVYFVKDERAGSREQLAVGGQRSAVVVRKIVVVR